jgi:[ribosomal protein S18]-alanine N-acetyltransferase
MVNLDIQVRKAKQQDHQPISNLIYYEPYIHRHLDWRTPLDWLGEPEFWVAEYGRLVTASLACPVDPAGIAWIRLFACSSELALEDSWSLLWKVAREALTAQGRITVAAISSQEWFVPLLQSSGFSVLQHIVILEHDGGPLPPFEPSSGITIRPMTAEDLPVVADVDAQAFIPLWQNSLDALQRALSQAGRATVAESKKGIVGYQISTHNPFGGHLARLAVRPGMQRRGIGRALVCDLLRESVRLGFRKFTVNTQNDNQASLALYQSLGFKPVREQYPVYGIEL